MKNEKLIEKIKKESQWYTMNKKEGVILNPRDDMNWEDNGHGCSVFYPFHELTLAQLNDIVALIEQDKNPCKATYDEYYGAISEKGAEITNTPRTNIENDQHTVYNEFSLIECAEVDEYRREYVIETSQYYDWKSELTDDMDGEEAKYISENEDDEDFDMSYYEPTTSEEFEKEKQEAYEKLSPEAKELID